MALLMSGVASPATAAAVPVAGVEIPDPALRACLMVNFSAQDSTFDIENPGAGITETMVPKARLVELEGLSCKDATVSDLTGLEYARKLKVLGIEGPTEMESRGKLKDLSALRQLAELEWLVIVNNSITDLTSFGEHPNLRVVNLSDNRIRDLHGLEKLPKLEMLYLSGNHIADITPTYDYEAVRYKNLQILALDSQSIEMKNLQPGETVESPVRDYLGKTIPLTDLDVVGTDFDTKFVVADEGPQRLAWERDITFTADGFRFSGVLEVTPAKVPPPFFSLPWVQWIIWIAAAAGATVGVAALLRRRKERLREEKCRVENPQSPLTSLPGYDK
ncbi:MAG: leucine-rich repeat domain-containing protein [Actinobacteria bacterium]|nr:leucine-rich repeat domain-containing protein [Actinomycetota bacterium]